jgi:hypothetical protein
MIDNKLTYVKGLVGAVVIASLLACTMSTATAMAEPSVWWGITSSTWPASLPISGEGTLDVVAENLGDEAVTHGTATITDKLPASLTAKSVRFFVPGCEGCVGLDFQREFDLCEVAPQSVTCHFPVDELGLPIPPYGVLEMQIKLKVEGTTAGAENEVAVTAGAGNGPTKVLRHQMAIGGPAASFGIENYAMTPEEEGGAATTQAGSHPFQLTTTLLFNQTADPSHLPAKAKDLNVKLPPGLIGNPTPFPQCSLAQFSSYTGGAGMTLNLCSPKTAVGVALVTIYESAFLQGVGSLPVPVFNLTPAVGEPARFGFVIFGNPVILDTSLRTGGDYGVTVNVKNISELPNFMASRVTFWGVPGDPSHDSQRGWPCILGSIYDFGKKSACTPLDQNDPPPLLSMPTSCTGPLQTTAEADSWQEPGSFDSIASEPLPAMDGCARLPSTPSISVAPDGQAGSTPTGLSVDVHVPQEQSLNGKGLAEADVKDTTVALPQGVVLNPAAADGLQACSLAQVALETPEPSTCPEASKVGTVEIHTPLLPNPLTGAAYLAAQNANPFGSLVALYVYVEDPISGSRVKLAGEVVPDPVTGQLVSTFKDTPQLPFEDFKLHFFGGDRAPLATPSACGAYTTTASIAPWSGNPPTESSSTFDVTSGPNGSACANPLPFAPSLTAGTTSIQAGGLSPFTMTMSREDGSQDLQAIKLTMPPGLSGLLSSVKLCHEPLADEGLCGKESEIGETTVSVGVGGDPYSVKGGKVFITEGYEGAPYGLSIVNPAKAGPYDLEAGTPCDCVVVRAKIEVDPTTAALTITSDDSGPHKIPTILDGIPLQIQHVNVTINRPGFTFNPTNCSPMKISGTLSSTEGGTAALSVPLQVTNCAVLGFRPGFAVSTSGKTSRLNGASLRVKLTYPKAPFGSQANIARVKVDLPKQLPSRLTTLQKACTAKQFEADPAGCPTASFIGHAKAITPLLPVPLEGPAIFVSHGGEAFPSLEIVLQGYGVTIDLVGSTFISHAGITSTTFKTVPDQPIGSFELTLPEGQYSALAANGNLCTSKLMMPTEFLAQNGAKINQSTKISVTGCRTTKALTRTRKLSAALRACHKKAKGKRASCEAVARRKHRAPKKARRRTKA